MREDYDAWTTYALRVTGESAAWSGLLSTDKEASHTDCTIKQSLLRLSVFFSLSCRCS